MKRPVDEGTVAWAVGLVLTMTAIGLLWTWVPMLIFGLIIWLGNAG